MNRPLLYTLAAMILCTGMDASAEAWRDCADCPELVTLQPGSFSRGAAEDDLTADENEFPRHEVRIEKPFAIATHLVARRDYEIFVTTTGYTPASGCHTLTTEGWRVDEGANWQNPGFPQTPSEPAICLSWHDAARYAAWMAARTGKPYRLPSEAEWEYAARGGTTGTNFWGEDDRLACDYANVNDLTAKNKVAKTAEPCTDGYLFTSPVGHFRPNPFGLHDAVGNVWVWLADCWQGDYTTSPRNGDAAGGEPCATRILRGGSWTDTPGPFRLGARENRPPDARLAIAGFRLARDIDMETLAGD